MQFPFWSGGKHRKKGALRSATELTQLGITRLEDRRVLAVTAVADVFPIVPDPRLPEDATFSTGNVLDNDLETGGDTAEVAEVEGSDANVGITVDLASGARVTVQSDGTFTYNTNGAFNHLSEGEFATDSFTYGANDGDTGPVSTATVTMRIVGTNDAPVITTGNVTAAENQTLAATLAVSDPDIADSHTWTLEAGAGSADNSRFSIINGNELRFNSAPNFESPNDANTNGVYLVRVGVNDGTTTVEKAITVTLTDENDAPVIDTAAFVATENDASVGMVEAIDEDVPADTLTFSLVSGAGSEDNGEFSITSGGILSFNSSPDFENPADANADNTYNVRVRVSDGTTSTERAITVIVTDANDPAVITTTNLNAAENQTATGTVIATDEDVPADTLTFSLVSGAGSTDNSRFSISSAGVLTFNSAPDFENPADANADNVYNVRVRVNDGTVNTDKAITVTVTSVNEAPVITTTNLNAAENQTAAGTVIATDEDSGDTLTFSLVSGTGSADNSLFSISSAGVLTFNAAPDFENPADAGGNNVYNVRVRVNDGTVNTDKAITVTVTDANDPAVITTTNLNAAENQTAAGTVIATDEDVPADTLTFSLVSGTGSTDNSRFSISSAGVLTFNSAPDFENPSDGNADNVYNVRVRVNDGTVNTDKAITVTVNDANDAPVITTTNLNAAENQTAAGTVIATDQDSGDTLSFSLVSGTGSADNSLFSISSAGVLTFNAAPDFENPADAGGNNVYNVRVRVNDGTTTVDKAITVTVTNANDAPVITTDNLDAAENQTAAGTVLATDQDVPANTLTFSLVSGTGSTDNSRFSISSGGVLTFNSAPDFENPADVGADNVYKVRVRVSDGTTSTEKAITVTVTDANDAPVITTTNLNAAENQTAAGTVIATDQDSGDTLAFSLVSGSGSADNGRFTISSAGVLTFNSAPDFENPSDANTNNVYNVRVRVNDGTTTVDKAITVTVTNVNDAPVITTNNLNAAENQTAAGTVIATDQDVPANTLTFSLVGGAGSEDNARFSISSGGVLTFTSAPDFEDPADFDGDNVYNVRVRVNDGTTTTEKAITVTVTDVNDAPIITTTNLDAEENQTAAGTVIVVDQDVPADTLTFSLVGGAGSADNNRFNISSSGVLTFKVAPDIENPADNGGNNIYNVRVRVNDGTVNVDKAITVTVTDVNDPPVITTNNLNAPENQTAAGTVLATDEDVPADTLTFSLVPGAGGADNSLFSISSEGVLTFNAAPDFESPADVGGNNVYNVRVNVNDGTTDVEKAITVTVTDVNEPPTARENDYAVASSDTLTGNVITDVDPTFGVDSDPDAGDTLEVIRINGLPVPPGPFLVLPSGARLTIDDDGDFTFNPRTSLFYRNLRPGESATEVFTYTIEDSEGERSTTTVRIKVNGRNDAPEASDDDFATDEDTAISGLDFIGANNGNGPDSDDDNDLSELSVSHINGIAVVDGVPISIASGATVTFDASSGTFTYNPNDQFEFLAPGQSQDDTFTYTLSDGELTDTATVTVTIAGRNDAPDAEDDAFTTDEDSVLTGMNLIGDDNGEGVDSDVDNAIGDLSVAQINGTNVADGVPIVLPSGATVTFNAATGEFSYNPNGQFDHLASDESATDTFTYTVVDLGGLNEAGGTEALADTATVTLTITGRNDAPVLVEANVADLETLSIGTINEDATIASNTGTTVSDILATSLIDVDQESQQGIAVTHVSSTRGNGVWQFQVDGETEWQNVGAVSDNNALVLRGNDRLRFMPNGLNGDTATLSFRGWDVGGNRESEGGGSPSGDKVDASETGGANFYSEVTATRVFVVDDVNDAPTADGQVFSSIFTEEDNQIQTIDESASELFSQAFQDVDEEESGMPNNLAGITITGLPTVSVNLLDNETDPDRSFTFSGATIRKNDDSWGGHGYKVGDEIAVTNAEDPTNNGIYRIVGITGGNLITVANLDNSAPNFTSGDGEDTAAVVTADRLPAASGQLMLGDTVLGVGSFVSLADLPNIRYQPAQDLNTDPDAVHQDLEDEGVREDTVRITFTFTVNDGLENSDDSATGRIFVEPVNDPPSMDAISSVAIAPSLPGAPLQILITGFSPGPANEAGQEVRFFIQPRTQGVAPGEEGTSGLITAPVIFTEDRMPTSDDLDQANEPFTPTDPDTEFGVFRTDDPSVYILSLGTRFPDTGLVDLTITAFDFDPAADDGEGGSSFSPQFTVANFSLTVLAGEIPRAIESDDGGGGAFVSTNTVVEGTIDQTVQTLNLGGNDNRGAGGDLVAETERIYVLRAVTFTPEGKLKEKKLDKDAKGDERDLKLEEEDVADLAKLFRENELPDDRYRVILILEDKSEFPVREVFFQDSRLLDVGDVQGEGSAQGQSGLDANGSIEDDNQPAEGLQLVPPEKSSGSLRSWRSLSLGAIPAAVWSAAQWKQNVHNALSENKGQKLTKAGRLFRKLKS